jgi:hypothetical protein
MEIPSVRPVDQQFLTWLRRCREQGRELTAVELKDKARQMVSQGTADGCHWFKLWVSRLGPLLLCAINHCPFKITDFPSFIPGFIICGTLVNYTVVGQ